MSEITSRNKVLMRRIYEEILEKLLALNLERRKSR